MRNFIYRTLQTLVLLAVAASFAQADNFMYFKKKAAAGGGISYVSKNSAIAKAVTLTGVTAGNLIVVAGTWLEGTDISTLSDGTNAPDGYSTQYAWGGSMIRFAYWLSSPVSGTVTYTWTNNAATTLWTTHAFEMSGGTFTLEDVDAANNCGGDGLTTITSLDETSTEAKLVAFGATPSYVCGAITFSNPLLDGAAVDQSTEAHGGGCDHGIMVMSVMNNPGTYNFTVTQNEAHKCAADTISFKIQ